MEYTKLNLEQSEIRLVSILPHGTDDSLIHCELHHVSLMRPPTYAALSYCWGDPNVTSNIILDDEIFPVTTNLYAALSHLRTTQYTLLWIDAICINQKDLVEKSSQLLLMGSIYRKASTTIAWLANLTFNSAGAFPYAFTRPAYSEETECARYLLQSRSVLNNSYWRRVWIIQELALSQDIVLFWTEGSLTFSYFQTAIEELNEFLKLGLPWSAMDIMNLDHVRNILQFRSDVIQEQAVSFFDALVRSQTSIATDVRDKVFALINMTYNGSRYIPVANYSQSCQDLCLDITLEALKATKSLDLLVLFASPEHTSWPSWLPNWVSLSDNDGATKQKFEYALRKTHSPWGREFFSHTAGLMRTTDRWRANGSQVSGLDRHDADLRLRACFIAGARLSCLSSDKAKTPGSVPSSPTNQIPLHYKSYDGKDPEKSSAKLKEVLFTRLFFALTVLGDTVASSQNSYERDDDNIWAFRSWWPSLAVAKRRFYPALYAWFEANQGLPLWGRTLGYWLQCQPKGKVKEMLHSVLLELQSKEDGNTFIYEGHVLTILQRTLDWGMRFVVTEDGHIGWADPRARAGDQIAVLVGCSIPVILRPRGVGAWSIVGGCFIHGYMDHPYGEGSRAWEIIEIS
jgi:hypothetical protein